VIEESTPTKNKKRPQKVEVKMGEPKKVKTGDSGSSFADMAMGFSQFLKALSASICLIMILIILLAFMYYLIVG